MSKALKLDSTTLSCLDYHWFWGLRYSKSPRPLNFSAEVDALLRDERELNHLKERQLTLYQKSALIRFFYWIFNIENYAFHSYILAACKAHHAYLDHSQEKSPTMEIKDIANWGKWKNTLAYAATRISSLLKTYIPHFEQAELKPTEPAKAKDEAIIVTERMQIHLKELRLQRNNGDSLSLVEIKSAYRKRGLSSHPDKGGTKEEFLRVKAAADFLNKMIPCQRNIRTLDDFNAFAKEIAALRAQLRAEEKARKIRVAEAFAEMRAEDKATIAEAVAAAINELRKEMSTHNTTNLSTESPEKPVETAAPRIPTSPGTADKQKFFVPAPDSTKQQPDQQPTAQIQGK